MPVSYTPSTYKAPFKAPARVKNVAPAIPSRVIASSSRPDSDDELFVDPDNAVAGPSGHKAIKQAAAVARQAISETNFYAAPKKKSQRIVIGEKSNKQRTTEWDGAIHDPKAEGAVVMQRPPQEAADRK